LLFLVVSFQVLSLIIGIYLLSARKLKPRTLLIMLLLALVLGYPSFLLVGANAVFLLMTLFVICLFVEPKKQAVSFAKKLIISISLPFLALLGGLLGNFISSSVLIFILRDAQGIPYDPIYLFSVSLLSSIISTILCFLTSHFSIRLQLERIIDKAQLWMLTAFLILLVMFFYLNITMMGQMGFAAENSLLGLLLVGGNTAIILAVLFITMRATVRVTQNEQLNEYTEQLEQQHTAVRKMRHDYLNILTSMTGYVDEGDIRGLKEYIENEVLPVEKQIELDANQFKSLQNLKIPPIKALLFNKMNIAQILGIKTTAEIPNEIDKLNVKYFDLSRILGIILDNAIEESEQCEAPEINIGIFKKNGSEIIIIENKCRLETPPLQKLKQAGFSTKGQERGLGLKNLDEMIAKEKHIFLETRIDEGVFSQKIKILSKK